MYIKGGKSKRTGGFSTNQCAHHRKNFDEGCFDLEALKYIAQNYNLKHPNEAPISLNLKHKDLWNNINDRMTRYCALGNELCWMTQVEKDGGMRKQLELEYFRPEPPKGGKRAWLSNFDILRVMKQFEKRPENKDFRFVGVFPIDFKEVSSELSRMCFGEYFINRKLKRIGMVFNTDPSHKGGKHWFCMFVDNTPKKFQIEFFDSTGREPMKEIKDLIDQAVKFAFTELGKESEIKINKKVHQVGDNACGVYVLNYITSRLNGKSFEDITENVIRDGEMNKLREYFFRMG